MAETKSPGSGLATPKEQNGVGWNHLNGLEPNLFGLGVISATPYSRSEGGSALTSGQTPNLFFLARSNHPQALGVVWPPPKGQKENEKLGVWFPRGGLPPPLAQRSHPFFIFL